MRDGHGGGKFDDVGEIWSMADAQDRWAAWLLEKRFGGDRDQLAAMLPRLIGIRDKVLDNANLKNVSLLLDVGAGDGLIAFGALKRIKPQARVIFSDISEDLLHHGRNVAEGLGVLDRVDFVLADACNLGAIESASVDAVTTRSVLIYVSEKSTALREFFRVLRSGGRISLAEPINRITEDLEIVVPEIAELEQKLKDNEATLCSSHEASMLDFTERDLLTMNYKTGFTEIHIELRIDVQHREAMPWETYLRTSPNPNAKTMYESFMDAFTVEQFWRYESHMKPLIESGKLPQCRAMAYISALKP